MNVIQWNPLDEFDRFFGERYPKQLPTRSSDITLDVYVEGDAVVVHASIPGVDTDSIEVTIEDDLLSISAHRSEVRDSKKEGYFIKEVWRGSFSRSVRLPKAVDAAAAVAEYVNGVLTVTMPVIPKEAENKITVSVKTP